MHRGNNFWIHKSEKSILSESNDKKYVPYFVGTRLRYATCSGVSWFNGLHLAVVNLYGNNLRVYKFDPFSVQPITLLIESTAGLSYPENVAISPDGLTMAIAHSLSSEHGLSVQKVNELSLESDLTRKMIRLGTYHGLDFSPDSRFLAVTEIAGSGSIEVINSQTHENTCILKHLHQDLKPKGISFSSDGFFVAIVYAANIISSMQTKKTPLVIDIHAYDFKTGQINSDALTSIRIANECGASYENCAFLPNIGDEYILLVTNQSEDSVEKYSFNSKNNKIINVGLLADQMSFPHGIDVSRDGRYIAVTNYGDDTIWIINNSEQQSAFK
jgi:DNA-binding beta-propeller fold protein YncE